MRFVYVMFRLPDSTYQIVETTVDDLYAATMAQYYALGVEIADRCAAYVPTGVDRLFFGRRLGRAIHRALIGERDYEDLWGETVEWIRSMGYGN